MSDSKQKLALYGGRPEICEPAEALFHWPIVTPEDEAAVLGVLRAGTMSGTEITRQFETEFADYMELPFALATCNGTAAIQAALWACGIGAGDEIICPSMTYWASALPALMLGATVNFADIDARSLCIDPADIEGRIGARTKALVVVHYAGHPCDMDPIMEIARRRGIMVIEDMSHAHGSLYKGTKCGTFGDIAAMSMMAGKSFPIGEAGMIVTGNRQLYERCVAFGHYERTGVATRWNRQDGLITDPELAPYRGVPLGAAKHRVNQICSAMGRVQLKRYPQRIEEIQQAMNCFWDQLADLPGLKAHRIESGSGSTMGGWYYPQGLYRAEELGGLSCARFCEAMRAEGVSDCAPGGNDPLHLHPVFHNADIFHMGQPTVLAFGQRDVRQGRGTLPVSERIRESVVTVPWFKHYEPEQIRIYVRAFRKVVTNHDQIL